MFASLMAEIAAHQNALERACSSIAADIAQDFPGWEIGFGLLGYVAKRWNQSRQEWDVVSSPSQTGLRALLAEESRGGKHDRSVP